MIVMVVSVVVMMSVENVRSLSTLLVDDMAIDSSPVLDQDLSCREEVAVPND